MYLSTRISSILVFVFHALFCVQSQDILNREQYALIAAMRSRNTIGPGAEDHRDTRQLLIKFTKSLDAMNKLLEHSMKGPSVGKAGAMAKYIKQGDLNTAVKDFYSVKPVVYSLPASGIYNAKGKVLLGRVGDHSIRVIEKGTADGRYPVLEFTDTRNTQIGPGVLVHRIIYKKENMD